MSKQNREETKKEIEDRYRRLKAGKRRPSLEYISTQDLREIFLPYVKNKDEFLKLSNEDVRKLYQEWYETTKNNEDNEDNYDEIFTLPELK